MADDRRDEFGLIDDFFAPLTDGQPGAMGLGDDGALLDLPPGHSGVVTADAMVAGIHFLADDPPDDVARKLLRVNLSDLAAMGAQPIGYLLVAAWPGDMTDEWIATFASGLARDQALFGCGLLGGDTVATSGPLTLSLTAIGSVPEGRALCRDRARPGERIFLSGTVGDAALGLRVLTGDIKPAAARDRAFLIDRYRLPTPRIDLGVALCSRVHCAMDVSDGVAQDLGHIARRSGCGAEIGLDALPLSPAGQRALDELGAGAEIALTGGDDYELLFTVAAGQVQEILDCAQDLGLAVTEIGRMVEGSGVRVLDHAGQAIAIDRPGWRHR